MFLKVGVFLYFLDLLTKCSGVCQPPCSVTGWGSWSSCRANGTQTRDKLYCCPKGITTLDACLQNCSITPESPAVQSCVYTDSKTLTTKAGIIVTHASKYILRGLSKRRDEFLHVHVLENFVNWLLEITFELSYLSVFVPVNVCACESLSRVKTFKKKVFRSWKLTQTELRYMWLKTLRSWAW